MDATFHLPVFFPVISMARDTFLTPPRRNFALHRPQS
jgi:hypothetical protein